MYMVDSEDDISSSPVNLSIILEINNVWNNLVQISRSLVIRPDQTKRESTIGDKKYMNDNC